jgi:hypothetical protein
MIRRHIEQIALWLIALFMMPAAIQATLAPRSFFDDFPLGRGWIAQGGEPFNEHLVRDVGGLFLAMIIVTVCVAWGHGSSRGVAIAWLVQGTLHLVFHVRHLHGFNSTDKVGLIGSLVTIPILAIVVLWAGAPEPSNSGSVGDQ